MLILLSLLCCDGCDAMLKPPILPAEYIVEAKGNDNSRVPASLCPFYASHYI